jgi:O-antigen/teichoic acid export membrane protein
VYLTTFITVFSTAAIILILYYCALFFFNIDFFTFLFNKSDSSYIYIVLLGAILVAITNLNQSRLVSLKMFKKIAISRFILPLFFFIFSIFFYIKHSSSPVQAHPLKFIRPSSHFVVRFIIFQDV